MTGIRKSIVFLAIAFTFSWGIAGLGWAMGASRHPSWAVMTLAITMFGPAIAAAFCALAFEKGRRRAALGLTFQPSLWWLWAWLLALALVFGATLLTGLLGHAQFRDIGQAMLAQARALAPAQSAKLDAMAALPGLSWLLVAQAGLLGALINTPILLLSEELGWRGYLYDLWRRFGFWRSTLAIGTIWGIWHAPAILLFGLNYPDNRALGVPIFVLFCVLIAIPMAVMRERSASTLAPAIFHGTLNAIAGLALLGLSNAAFPWNGVVGIGGLIMLTGMAMGCVLLQSGNASVSGNARVSD